ncbi:magnesium transporter CorA family protein [Candidatus Parcubacteria bacterium]|nr:magnesium transporter CorA family protein [Candidatus Parcubacteria bacterium]
MPKYNKISDTIQQITIDNPDTKDKLIWLNIRNAGKKEIEYLRKNYSFDLSDLQASSAKSMAQRPTVEQKKDYLFMILHFPVLQAAREKSSENNKKAKSRNIEYTIIPGEIEFFMGKDYLITLHNDNIKALNDFFNLCKKDGDSLLAYKFESPAVLLYELLERLMQFCFKFLDQNSIEILKVEEIIFQQMQKQAVSHILSLRHNIINFRKIMQNHKNIIKKLMQMENELIPQKKIKKYYIELLDHSKRIWEILENQKDMINVLNNTNESLLNYRLSDIMKTLTIFSVIVFPLTLLAAIFGMNIMGGMPFTESKDGFWIIIAIMLLGCFCMLLFFKKKKWL